MPLNGKIENIYQCFKIFFTKFQIFRKKYKIFSSLFFEKLAFFDNKILRPTMARQPHVHVYVLEKINNPAPPRTTNLKFCFLCINFSTVCSKIAHFLICGYLIFGILKIYFVGKISKFFKNFRL